MPILNISVTPSHSEIARHGQRFQHLSGDAIKVKFYGANGEWEEEAELVAGDSMAFAQPYVKFEVSSDFGTIAQVYSGFADMRRARQDLTPIGASRIRSRMVRVRKGEQQLIEASRDRRRVVIKPLNGEVYVGAMATAFNDKMPVEIGIPLPLEMQGALYAEIAPNFELQGEIDYVDVRIIEELN
ncbi:MULTISPECIES: hypothetical protein [unclassified Vibrio]|uniref:hypothetical protein n=1 Tax=unclassified Vibrio TaxID=2614977 RepID=UPI0013614D57|nr:MULTISPECIES: hypothetical protein [unclassified Vibrio]NAW57761.1 hypothetical protein [Vibrio sp. V36_P2S2PM302]NAX28422.1 hypothetical protein [Vibrio sp. V38_P2S17PM301]NAX29574.1 hypothetical protein [Vibrio sp. V37_P2S8PM304]